MKQTFFAMFAAVVLLLGMTGCNKEDNSVTIDVKAAEADLVGLWWEEYDYSGETETGKPFTRVMFAVYVSPDHTGWIALGAYDNTSPEAVALYGGPDDAPFTWQVLPDGRIQLGDPETGEVYTQARALTRAGDGNYGNNMTNVANTNLTYNANGTVTATNGDHSGKLTKASAEQESQIKRKVVKRIKSDAELQYGGGTKDGFDEDDMY